jgi:hypothetical protein
MVNPPRILYGLHESFVLFPYERGAKRARLVLRCAELDRLCAGGIIGKRPLRVGAPLVLGEILECKMAKNVFVPVVCDGYALNALKAQRVEWCLRSHRVVGFADRSIRFESGSSTVFAAHTAYYSLELLLQLTRGLHEPNPRTGVP